MTGLAAILAAGSAEAANSTCSTSGNQATCTGTGTDGVAYTSGVSGVTVNAPASPGQTVVNANTIGVLLSRAGLSGGSGLSTEGTKQLTDTKGDNDASNDVVYLAYSNNQPILTDDGKRILVTKDSDNNQVLKQEGTGTTVTSTAISQILSQAGAGSGDVAGDVTVKNTANFKTSNANGIDASATGGNGGNGGTINILFIVDIGEDGGDGKGGGSVSVNNSGEISVSGTDKYGIVALSKGGTGGKGGGFGGLVSDPGAGGNGGSGGAVNVTLNSTSNITTDGAGGHGVFAQSVGGDGGAGGSSGGAVVLGSDGGDGGPGGSVVVSNGGKILTKADAAYGIYARSYGAGAGSGSNAGGIVAIGGNGGGFASGGTVDVFNDGAIETNGVGSFGVLAQSIGGGGGDGGDTGGLFTIGGKAGSGGNGATVTYTQTSDGSVTTTKDRATAILAQSIGGGGGNGGNAISVSTVASIALGGSGGPGGTGGDVIVKADGTVSTGGNEANAIMAQSIGGGGGTGGLAVAANISEGYSASVAIGGTGGTGGGAGKVDVTSNAAVGTTGNRSSAIVAQSIGGGGGNGGLAVAASVGASISVNVSVAGGGGGGGAGGEVDVKSDGGSLTTKGENAYGILAQSLGGGGGAGGLSVTGAISAGNIGVSLGGAGGPGGAGKQVTVANLVDIDTTGSGATGIIAQSIGGGGGEGGLSVAASLSASVSINVGIGGNGGAGANAALVDVDNSGEITTRGVNAYGILAQSIGGSGGAGGNTITASAAGNIVAGSVAIGIGGSGGSGGTAGDVHLDNYAAADITTIGAGSTALIAQSIGGGGGAGGYAVAATLTISKDGGGAVSVALGGGGGDGGTAGKVVLNNSATLDTTGDEASGIIAQSLGGAGGVGGTAVAGALNFSKGAGIAVSVALGGSGGDGGTAHTVDVDNDGNITTRGADAYGVLAQSIGGSGGVGGMSIAGSLNGSLGPAPGVAISVALGGNGGKGGTADVVTVDNTGDIVTTGARSSGVVAQSIGGEGGTGGLSVGAALAGSQAQTGAVAVSLGGSGGGGGEAGDVVLTNSGDVSTSGYSDETEDGKRVNTDAHALIAQSIGGSGGIGGIGGSAAIAVGKEQTASAAISVGGFGGPGGEAGDVTIDNTGNLSTGTDNSIGIVAQSIGGGGGAGGGSIALSLAFSQQSNSGAVGVSIGGGGGAGVKAGAVNVDSTGDISTKGDSAYAILAQSIGGDGGQGGFTVAATGDLSRDVSGAIGVAVGGFGGVGGTAGDVTVGATKGIAGTITTTGDNAAAIVAQSIGGGGGSGGFAASLTGVVNLGANKRTMAIGATVGGFGGSGGHAGTVEVNTADDAVIRTSGDFAYGVLAQSIGGKGGDGGGAIGAVFNVATEGNSSLNAALTVGGFGGSGAIAGDVIVNNAGLIMTGDVNDPNAGEFAHGILAQSIGGDGGAGGFSGSVAFAAGASNQTANNYSLSASVGGFGGTGADAGTVTVDNTGMIVTLGERARGIVAQSIGGGGGAGGDSGLSGDVWGEKFLLDTAFEKVINGETDQLDLGAGGAYAGGYGANSHALVMSVGGFGGAGGNGSTVDVTNEGTIWTFGEDGHAIFAQSVGGGGGSGGVSTAATVSAAASNDTTVSLAVGGFGGAAGNGGNVSVDNSGEIITVYNGAYGVFAQSVGGGGGAGGDTRGFTLQRKDTTIGKSLKPGKQITVTVGGFGGAGGDSGTVDVTNSGNIQTFGTGSLGIFAQAVGGGGGEGGNSSVSSSELSAFFEDDESAKKQFRTWKYKLALGGFGGAGGIGKAVTVDNTGSIATVGEQATAIYAQSVGGGGGTGGKGSTGFSGDISIGGFGGTGNDGGTVAVSNTGEISTVGGLSDGIFAQSVGGGGGDGGAADFGNARSFRGEMIKAIRRKGFKEGMEDLAKKIFLPTFGIGVGGFGGASGDGGDVFVCNGATFNASTSSCSGSAPAASITTRGDASNGIFAQSVGGGGGTGGQAYLTNVGKIGIGGLGGAAGNGGSVTVVNNGDITTTGTGSYGVFAQSVGGGGGLAGDITIGITGLGKDETKLVRNFGQYLTPESVPGVDLDGDGTVTPAEVTQTQQLFGFGAAPGTSTVDENGLPVSNDLLAQFAALYGGSLPAGTDPLSFSPANPLNGLDGGIDSAASTALLAALNAAGIDMKTEITNGLKAAFPGLASQIENLTGDQVVEFLQKAFTTDGTSITLKTGEVFDLLNGITGDGGAVSVTTTGNIIVTGGASSDPTERAGSIGIFAQSVGGGGGIVGNTVKLSEADIDTDLNGDGDKSDTFDVSDGTAFAGTVGGHGKGGTVFVSHSGSIIAPSLNGIGIFAQSVGGDGGSDITIKVDNGTIQGGELNDDGTGEAAAILIDGGANNTLTIGPNSTIFATSERAIIGSGGNEAVTSEGHIIGNIDLGTGTNSLTNKTAGFFETRTTINLNGGTFENGGDLQIGSALSIGSGEPVTTTALGGSYLQTDTGKFFADMSFGLAPTDVLNVTGSATVDGALMPHLMSLATISPPTTFIHTDGGAHDGGITVADTLAIDYGIVFTADDVQLAINSIDFTPNNVKLTRNQAALGDFITKVLDGQGSEALGPYFAFLANLQPGDENVYTTLLQRTQAEPYAARLAPILFSALDFGNILQSCPVEGDVGAIIYEGQCVWARASGGIANKDATSDFSSFSDTTYAFAAGGEIDLAPGWHAGAAVQYEQSRMTIGDLASSKGDHFNFGGIIKYQQDSFLLSAAATGGYGWYDTKRFVDLGGFIPGLDQATSDSNVANAHFQFRAARLFQSGNLYAKPILDLTATYLDTQGMQEAGLGALDLHLKNSDDWIFAATPSLEIGAQLTAANGDLFRPYIRGGVTWFSNDKLGVDATFDGAPPSAGTFRSVSDLDKTVANLTAGIDILSPSTDVDLRLNYDGRFGIDTYESHTGSAKLIVNY